MASVPIGGDPAPVIRFPSVPPMPAVARILSRYDRPTVEAFLAVAIDLLDTLDGPADPDQPDFRPRVDGMAGDPEDGEPTGDEGDWAWPEWDRRDPYGKRAGVEADALSNCGRTEDDEQDDHDEDDDPAGQADEDGVNTGSRTFWRHGVAYNGPGCPISDSDQGDDE